MENDECDFCGEKEDLLHVLQDCSGSRGSWHGECAAWCNVQVVSFREWLAWIMENFDKKVQETFAVMVWQIWKARNERIFQKLDPCPRFFFKKATDICKDYLTFCTRPSHKQARERARWTALAQGMIKIKFDATMDEELGNVGLGLIARKDDGEFLLAKVVTLHHHWSAELCEAKAAMTAVDLALQYGWQQVVIEGDAQEIIRALEGKATKGGYVGAFVNDSRFLASSLDLCSFSFCFRECNEVAHRLARWVVFNYCDEVWHNEGPSWIEDLLISYFCPAS